MKNDPPSDDRDWLKLGHAVFGAPADAATRRKSERAEAPKSLDAFAPASLDRELNPYFRNGGSGLPPSDKAAAAGHQFGDAGSGWRLAKLARLFEESRRTGRSAQDLGRERYGSREAFEDALRERDFVERRASQSSGGSRRPSHARSVERPRGSSSGGPLRPTRHGDSAHKEPRAKVVQPMDTSRKSNSLSTPERAMTQKELDILKAKVLKARIMDPAAFPALQRDYEAAKARAAAPQPRPAISAPTAPQTFQPSSSDSVQTLARAERVRSSGGRDYDRAFADAIIKSRGGSGAFGGRHSGAIEALDEAVSSMTERRSGKRGATAAAPRDQRGSERRCKWCRDNDDDSAFVPVTQSRAVTLGVPVESDVGHWVLVPRTHVASSLELDQDEFEELRNFFKALIHMHANENPPRCCVFYEAVPDHKQRRHTVIECFPVSSQVFPTMRGYIREAFLSAEAEEWSQHRKVLSTAEKGFRRSLAKEMPVAHFWLDASGGLAHVIEDGEAWSESFGREVVAGILELGPEKWRRRRGARATDPSVVRRVRQLQESFAKFDWTASG